MELSCRKCLFPLALCSSSSPLRHTNTSSAFRRSYGSKSRNMESHISLMSLSNLRARKFHGKLIPVHVSVQPAKDEFAEDSRGTSVQGDSIRRRFLEFFASRGHKILPSSSLVPDDPTVLLTIAGMLQFKPVFLGKIPRSVPRATTSQKCIRTNDVENVGRTARHHTFFEMLGNFSFGDYFKKDAIIWAWELSTHEFGLPAERLWVSVYEDDDEAYEIWRKEVGVFVDRIKRMGAEDNFWSSGVTGPCGPCSELYYDFHPERGPANADLGDDTRFIEFYNLVFMQYNRTEDGDLEPLQQKNIDTGLGLERLARILQNVPNNYETDLIFPIMEKAAELANVSYFAANEKTQTGLKVIADHLRAVVYLISDGVLPSNIGRGYVVRRLIRRAIRTGRLVGIKGDGEGAFLPAIAVKVIELSGGIDSKVKVKDSQILEEIKREELRFVQTLERGEKLLSLMLEDAVQLSSENGLPPCLSGQDAFLLYDTYGFPVEITTEVAEERGVRIDMDAFDAQMDKQRRMSQSAHNAVKLTVDNDGDLTGNTEFLGYDTLSARALVETLVVNGKSVPQVHQGEEVEVLLNRTPFYAESGGQVGDHGVLCLASCGDRQEVVVEIEDVQKSSGNIFVHKGRVREGVLEVGKEIEANVDPVLRHRLMVHHTSTHLLQSALKIVIGKETSQAGSLVNFDRLRFDFNFHRALADSEVEEIEELINKWIAESASVETEVMGIEAAKDAGAIAMFGEKYGERVRVVEVPGVSMELCGGTHVRNTAEIRAFKVMSEQGIASGVRRIEAVAGQAYIEYMNVRDSQIKQLCSTLKAKAEEVTSRVENVLEDLRASRNEIAVLRKRTAEFQASVIAANFIKIGDIKVVVESMGDVDADSLKSAAEHMLHKLEDPAAIVLGSCPGHGKVSLVVALTPTLVQRGLSAANLIGAPAKLCGGGGGGRPNFAQAGGRNPDLLQSALARAKDDLLSLLSSKFSF